MAKTRRSRTDTDGRILTSPMPTPRRRSTLRDLQAAASSTSSNGDFVTPKIINAAPSLEKAQMYGIEDPRPAWSKVMALLGRIFIETIPQWLAVGAMLGLIFGGCCSNVSLGTSLEMVSCGVVWQNADGESKVFALEAIVK